MVETAIQWLGIVSAWPVVLSLGASADLAADAYDSLGLRIKLVERIEREARVRLDRAAASSRAASESPERLAEFADRLRDELGSLKKRRRGDRPFELRHRATAALLDRRHDRTVLDELEAARSQRHAEALEALERRLSSASDDDLVLDGRRWASRPAHRIRAVGFQQVGIPVVGVIIRRACQWVTIGGVWGLIAALAAWPILSDDTAFLGFIGNGTALGAFCGIAATAVRTQATVLGAMWAGEWVGRSLIHRALVVAMILLFIVSTLVLTVGYQVARDW
jgi:hypothetical protein